MSRNFRDIENSTGERKGKITFQNLESIFIWSMEKESMKL